MIAPALIRKKGNKTWHSLNSGAREFLLLKRRVIMKILFLTYPSGRYLPARTVKR